MTEGASVKSRMDAGDSDGAASVRLIVRRANGPIRSRLQGRLVDYEKNYAALYTKLGRLLAEVPVISDYQSLSRPECAQWLARAHALVEAVGVGNGFDAMSFRSTMDNELYSGAWQSAVKKLLGFANRALAHCELYLPVSAAGAFVPAGDVLDAFAAITKLFGAATSDILIVDPYLDESALVDFGAAVPTKVTLRLLADSQSVKGTLAPAVARWKLQHGATRPIEARVTVPRMLHDRAIFIDGAQAWILTQSLKDFAKRSPAELMRADGTASLKIAAYEAIWAGATPV